MIPICFAGFGGSTQHFLFSSVWSKKLFCLVRFLRIRRIPLNMPIIAGAIQNKPEELSLGFSVGTSEVICDGCTGVRLVGIVVTGVKNINRDVRYALAFHVLRDQCLGFRLVAGTTDRRESRAKTGQCKRGNNYSRLGASCVHSDRFTLSRGIFSSIDALLSF